MFADVVTVRGLSPSSVPAAEQPRAGVGTCHGAGLARHHRGGCRGFTGPYPSTPLDELYEVVLTTLTDGSNGLALQATASEPSAAAPGRGNRAAAPARAAGGGCPNLAFHERRTGRPGTDRIQPRAGILHPGRRRE